MNHATSTDGVWRVMRFENAEGKWAEVASNHVGPEAMPIPPGYKFVKSTPMVPCDDAAIERVARRIKNTWPGHSDGAYRALAENCLRAAGETP